MNELSATPAVPPSPPAPRRRLLRTVVLTIVGAAALAAAGYAGYAVAFPADVPEAVGAIVENLTGANPHPVVLKRPVDQPLLVVQGQNLAGHLSCRPNYQLSKLLEQFIFGPLPFRHRRRPMYPFEPETVWG